MNINPQDNPQEWAQLVQALSVQFSEDLSTDIGPKTLAYAAALNRADSNTNVCHSHDFCDANMVMHGSFITVLDRDPTQDDQYLIDSAWNEAKEFNFNLS